MSVTFSHDKAPDMLLDSPCTSCDNDLIDISTMNMGEREEFCEECYGTGVVTEQNPESKDVNMSNDNANLILRILGLTKVVGNFLDDGFTGDLSGQTSVPEMRRAILKALNSDLSKFVRDDRVETTDYELGNIHYINMPRVYSMGVDESYFINRLNQLSELCLDAQKRGANYIYWS